MSHHPIPADAQRLADRLKMLADEILSAARYGVPIPFSVNVSGHTHGHAGFSASEHEFAAWVEYTEARTEDYEHGGYDWSAASVNIGDGDRLPLHFHVRHEAAAVTS